MPGVRLISPSHLSFMDVMGPLEVSTMFRSSFHTTTNYLSLLLLVEITLVLSHIKINLTHYFKGGRWLKCGEIKLPQNVMDTFNVMGPVHC